MRGKILWNRFVKLMFIQEMEDMMVFGVESRYLDILSFQRLWCIVWKYWWETLWSKQCDQRKLNREENFLKVDMSHIKFICILSVRGLSGRTGLAWVAPHPPISVSPWSWPGQYTSVLQQPALIVVYNTSVNYLHQKLFCLMFYKAALWRHHFSWTSFTLFKLWRCTTGMW